MKSARWSMLFTCVWLCASPGAAQPQEDDPSKPAAPEEKPPDAPSPGEEPAPPEDDGSAGTEAPADEQPDADAPTDSPKRDAAPASPEQAEAPATGDDEPEGARQEHLSPNDDATPSDTADVPPPGASQAPATADQAGAGEGRPSPDSFDATRMPVGKRSDEGGADWRSERRTVEVDPSPYGHTSKTSTASAPTPRFGLGLSLDALWNTDASYDAFSDDDARQRFGIWARYDPLRLEDMLVLGIEVGWGAAAEEESLQQGELDTQLDTHTLHAAVLLQYARLGWLQPHVRLAGGATRLDASFATDSVRFEDGSWSAFGSLGGGLHVQTPPGTLAPRTGFLRALTFGVLIEGGYVLAQDVTFELKPSTSAEDIPVRGAPLGELNRSGPYLRFSVYSRF